MEESGAEAQGNLSHAAPVILRDYSMRLDEAEPLPDSGGSSDNSRTSRQVPSQPSTSQTVIHEETPRSSGGSDRQQQPSNRKPPQNQESEVHPFGAQSPTTTSKGLASPQTGARLPDRRGSKGPPALTSGVPEDTNKNHMRIETPFAMSESDASAHKTASYAPEPAHLPTSEDDHGSEGPPTSRAVMRMDSVRRLFSYVNDGFLATFTARVRRMPAVFVGNRYTRAKKRNEKEVHGYLHRLRAEKTYVVLVHLCSGCSLLSILMSVMINEWSYDCLWHHNRRCTDLDGWKWVTTIVSMIQFLGLVTMYFVRCSSAMAESPMRVKAHSAYILCAELLLCLFLAYPNAELDFSSPFGGTTEVYTIENYATALVSLRFFSVLRSIREMMRIRDGGMLFVARIIRVRTWSFGFNLKYAIHINPVSSLLLGFIFFILWLSYLTRVAELPAICRVDGIETECAHETEDSNYNNRHIRNTFWMVIVTVATVGYGDMVPKTFFGRVFIGLVILLGNVWTSLLLGIVVEKIQLSKSEKQMVDLVQHKSWRSAQEHWGAVWIQRWWKYKLDCRRQNGVWKPRGMSGYNSLGRQATFKAASDKVTSLKRQYMTGIRAAHDKFTGLMSNQRTRPVADTTLHELRRSLEDVEEGMKAKFEGVEGRFSNLETLLQRIDKKLS